ncbi:hypothetical protein G7Y89_g9617 [Cudoniella acicularis]|uniref:Arrestin-like N-terminal domain-containing protein n=1 Tax=Cudoniella acicularis TaxID=354080 RepID=A0A8H4VZG4_9HELO|nr:hypothetical protein G7Y89_g9617 [Cudoniella acicularis]
MPPTAIQQLANLQILLNNPSRIYTGGDFLTGSVLVKLSDRPFSGYAQLTFFGRTKTKIVVRSNKHTYYYRGRRVLFEYRLPLFDGGVESEPLNTEIHSWPFTFQIPTHNFTPAYTSQGSQLPSSYYFHDGHSTEIEAFRGNKTSALSGYHQNAETTPGACRHGFINPTTAEEHLQILFSTPVFLSRKATARPNRQREFKYYWEFPTFGEDFFIPRCGPPGYSELGEQPGDIHSAVLDLGQILDIRATPTYAHTQKVKALFLRPLVPTFSTFNIAVEYGIRWKIELECAGEKETISNYDIFMDPCLVLAPAGPPNPA